MAPKLVQADFQFPAFANEADIDYLMARMISFIGPGFMARAGFMAQQACEKYMKALLVQEQSQYPQSHKLLELADLCSAVDPYFAEEDTKRILGQFDLFDQVGRYGLAANYDPLAAKGAGAEIAGVAYWEGKYLGDLDSFVFKTRGFLDWDAVGFGDGLKFILEKNRKSLLYGSWTGRQPIRVVLTKDNAYFKKQPKIQTETLPIVPIGCPE